MDRKAFINYTVGFNDLGAGMRQGKKPVAHSGFLDWVTQVMPFTEMGRERNRFGEGEGDGDDGGE